MSIYVVAEIGVNHNGSLDKALKLIKEASICGCNAVKFQSFYAERLVDKAAQKVKYQLRSGDSKETHFEMIKRLEFNKGKLSAALDYAQELGLDFITTPYDPESLLEAYAIGVRSFKIASADLGDFYIHKKLATLEKIKVILATGMSDLIKIKRTVEI